VVQWHSDTFAIPEGGIRLATSPACRNQAFRFGQRAYGLQFHPEVTATMVEEWAEVPEYAKAMRQVSGPTDGGRFDGVAHREAELARRARLLYQNFRALVARGVSA
jgi:GMP synthase-like glutamine amidotransferase